MHEKTHERITRRPTAARIAVAAFYLAGVTAIVGWSLPEKVSPGHSAKVAMRLPDPGVSGANVGQSIPARVAGRTRNDVNCRECGVVESVRRIDRREEIMGWCAAGNAAGTRLPGNLIDAVRRDDPVTLADTVADVIAGERGARKARLTTRHQIVVRLRDGSRQVFDETTPRTLRVGDRVKVIAGATAVSG